MDRNTIKKEIIALVSSIKSQSDILADEGYPAQVDLELFLHKVEKLYQKSIVFNHLSLFDGFEEVTASEPVSTPLIITEPPKEENSLSATTVAKSLDQPFAASELTTDEIPTQKKDVSQIPETKVELPKVQKSFPDLKQAMGINDKFQFTNELFKGNMQEFNIAIEQLNAAASAQSAKDYIQSLRQLYEWDEENDTLKRFLNIIEKRYT